VANHSTPGAVAGLSSGVRAISGGAEHTCALTTAGAVLCWGDNSLGQLGDGTITQRNVPVAVSGLGSGVVAIATGAWHTCALTGTGAVMCLGINSHGQLGDGTTTEHLTPIAVSGLSSGVTAIAAGDLQTCAVTAASAVQCWGINDVGDGTNSDRYTPTTVSGLASGGAAIAIGSVHACALTAAGGVRCWGYNDFGMLGNGSSIAYSLIPVDVLPFTALDPATVATGEYHSCTLTHAGTVFCWGDNANGELGIGSALTQSTVPAAVPDSANLTALSLGAYHTCAVTTAGAVQCWGYNYYGQLGNGSTNDSASPTAVSGLSSGISSVAAGLYHTCAMTTGGAAQCWGYNYYGQLGNGNNTNSSTPVAVSGIGANGITAGGYSSCTMSAGWFPASCWGYNGDGELGNNTTNNSNTPTFVWNLSGNLNSISSGGYHTCGVTTAGAAQCWGYNGYGELGNGSLANSSTATNVSGLASGAASISAGAFHSCAVTTSGAAQCWGDNYNGQLGSGNTNNSSTPVSVLSGVATVAAGGFHSCALTTAGSVQCWGYNYFGELGNGTTSNSTFPVIAIYAGQDIAFNPPSTVSQGASIALTASASSDMTVSFDTWTPSTCSVSGTTLTITGTGLCGVRASQSGWAGFFYPTQFAAAPQQLRLIRIQ